MVAVNPSLPLLASRHRLLQFLGTVSSIPSGAGHVYSRYCPACYVLGRYLASTPPLALCWLSPVRPLCLPRLFHESIKLQARLVWQAICCCSTALELLPIIARRGCDAHVRCSVQTGAFPNNVGALVQPYKRPGPTLLPASLDAALADETRAFRAAKAYL